MAIAYSNRQSAVYCIAARVHQFSYEHMNRLKTLISGGYYMKLLFQVITVFIFSLVPIISHTSCIDFEDLTPLDPWYGYPTDGWGRVQDGYHGFDWSSDRMGNPAAADPQWASVEGFMLMPDVGYSYVHTSELSLIDERTTFDVLSVNVGSYYYNLQDVYAAAWENSYLKYVGVITLNSIFQVSQFNLNFIGINHFALWAGNGGTLTPPLSGVYPHELCIDSIVYENHAPAPVSEPSTLLILGSGILGLTRMYRRYLMPG